MVDTATGSANIVNRDDLDTCSQKGQRVVSRWWWWWWWRAEVDVVVASASALVSGGGVGVAEKKVFAVITVWGLVLEGLRNGAAGAGGWGRRSYIRMRGRATWVHSSRRLCLT